jgi:hypothetical protein
MNYISYFERLNHMTYSIEAFFLSFEERTLAGMELLREQKERTVSHEEHVLIFYVIEQAQNAMHTMRASCMLQIKPPLPRNKSLVRTSRSIKSQYHRHIGQAFSSNCGLRGCHCRSHRCWVVENLWGDFTIRELLEREIAGVDFQRRRRFIQNVCSDCQQNFDCTSAQSNEVPRHHFKQVNIFRSLLVSNNNLVVVAVGLLSVVVRLLPIVLLTIVVALLTVVVVVALLTVAVLLSVVLLSIVVLVVVATAIVEVNCGGISQFLCSL